MTNITPTNDLEIVCIMIIYQIVIQIFDEKIILIEYNTIIMMPNRMTLRKLMNLTIYNNISLGKGWCTSSLNPNIKISTVHVHIYGIRYIDICM